MSRETTLRRGEQRFARWHANAVAEARERLAWSDYCVEEDAEVPGRWFATVGYTDLGFFDDELAALMAVDGAL